jgi:hypothetical protein
MFTCKFNYKSRSLNVAFFLDSDESVGGELRSMIGHWSGSIA